MSQGDPKQEPTASENSSKTEPVPLEVLTGGSSNSADRLQEQNLIFSENPPETLSAPRSNSECAAAHEGNSLKRRPVSMRKILANRANSMKSPGPTSPAGKNRVRWNSLKHGLSAKSLFWRPIDGEEMAQYFRFFKALHRDLRPDGMLEELHVEGAAAAYWLSQRSLRSETGEIRRSQLKRKGPKGEDFLGSVTSTELAEIGDHLSIPQGQALGRILRYRTAAHKDLSYHLAELERLQRARKGDHIPPPINIQVR